MNTEACMMEFNELKDILSIWRDEDNYDNLTLSRHEVIVLLEGIKHLEELSV